MADAATVVTQERSSGIMLPDAGRMSAPSRLLQQIMPLDQCHARLSGSMLSAVNESSMSLARLRLREECMLRHCAGLPELELLQEGAEPSQQVAPPCSLPSCNAVAYSVTTSGCVLFASPSSLAHEFELQWHRL